MISKDQGCPGCYPRLLAPALFILALGQSQLLNYRTYLRLRLSNEGCQPWHPSLPPPAPPPPKAYPGFEKGAKVQQPFRNDHTGDWIWCEGTIQYRLRDPGDNGGPQIWVIWHRQKELDQGSSAPDKPEGYTLELTSAHPI